ncbi:MULTISPECIES: FAD/NAD(P)-binding oxidoreductase [unclassified Pseudomonas]|uniref:NAD(P)/FAD-dependent oxidoreductase n=1 Tax=unclassified Pseudomonas TaxID=196821 RepID=UPI000BC68C29|nr:MULTISPECIES: FAD/NAD(P)-binding oxidoreductase [unclassified Pseudomonas]PVZ08657.1 NADPH-dependent 2,4-dienoyl-CoA reductase/sulfur reductase-like enzyme [Pseudomonas sp. URIL14HWK12:I12]PVZ21084.1 NADPH-dependent 2,4-dienoyl-CoA reductase/sulfur reductase-like enzyme [Pseudomonas sp. URIL14HWK12:I10]PVZ29671.1 NADPH-dependent 2,4-dienoyl-CoA reductase/sulfur reductase-like enzyme [Pseudomonas sp. URIL14HWK12:I11]SNZ18910.1 NADPH-dependent 2,4-dienoyl-CoA reductase, sulfur reductase [Pseud
MIKSSPINLPTTEHDGRTIDTDVLVIGSGPAGMSTAIGVAQKGLKVIVLDLQPTPGGQIFRSLETNLRARPTTDKLLEVLGPTYLAGQSLIEQFRSTDGIDYRPETTVWDLRSDGTVGWLCGDSAGYLRARQVVVANGATERPVPFPGWTLPGVMTAGAVQTLLKAGRLQPDGQVVLVGTGPLIFLLADQLRRLGVRPTLIARTDSLRDKFAALTSLRLSAIPALAKGLGWLAQLKVSGIKMNSGATSLEAHGSEKVESVSLLISGRTVKIPCDLLVVHDGIVPATDIVHCAGLAMDWQQDDASWKPRTADDGRAELATGSRLVDGPCKIRISGDARRIGGADAAIAHGQHIAAIIASELNGTAVSPGEHAENAANVSRTLAARPFIDKAFPRGLAAGLPADETLVCRCEELTAGDIRTAIRSGATEMNHLRGVLRCGMGPCQGRSCAVTVARLLTELSPSSSAPKLFRARPPLRPLPLIALTNLTGLDPDLAQIVSLEDKPVAGLEEHPHG